MRWFD